MELAKIRNLSDEELKHQEKTSSEQLFRLRFQVAMGQNDGVKKLRQLKKEIAQIKTVARERELGIRGEAEEPKAQAPKAEEAAPTAEAKVEEAAPEAKPKARKTAKKAASADETKQVKAKGARK